MMAHPTEADLHAYVDGRLERSERLRVEDWLMANPDWAMVVSGWQRDAKRLRTALAMPDSNELPLRFSAQRLQERQRSRRRGQLAIAASLLLTLGIGTLLGWQAGHRAPLPFVPMADAVEAHRLFADNPNAPLAFSGSDTLPLQHWMATHFDAGSVPSLTITGFKLVGAQPLVTDAGAALLLLYEDQVGQRISVYLRPRSRLNNHAVETRRDGDLIARYWVRGPYGYAVVGSADDPRAGLLQQHFAPHRT
ncbi:anti-sigma factor family protein [Solimonas marina]|uniref:Anti-sigma factor n=1 Tax=Solimonas marina TaxID=2714601 RepID=A0A969WDM0_9GAMM|nr:anti-sigma factor [Solimonas marina]NKF24614.1 anti-sigma factor [Solimonas marina]